MLLKSSFQIRWLGSKGKQVDFINKDNFVVFSYYWQGKLYHKSNSTLRILLLSADYQTNCKLNAPRLFLPDLPRLAFRRNSTHEYFIMSLIHNNVLLRFGE